MTKWAIRLLWWIPALALLLIALGWLILAAPFFADLRRTTVERVLSEQIGQPLFVRDDVSVVVGPVSRVYVGGVEIPSESMPDTNLAELNVLELDLDLMALLNRKIDLDNLSVDGLQINMLTLADGSTSWTKTTRSTDTSEKPQDSEKGNPAKVPPSESEGEGILGFLNDKTASFTEVGLTIDDEVSGFSFVFDLKNFNFDQLDEGARIGVASEGAVNGQTFLIEGNYPRGAAFTTRASFGAMELSFDGAPISSEQGGGFAGQLTLDTGEFGDFLEVLGLDRALEGQGTLKAELTSQQGLLRVADLETVIDLSEGQQLKAVGSVENLLNAAGFDVVLSGRFHPEEQPPEHADKLKDLKLTGVSAHIVSKDEVLEFDELLLATNAFDENLDQVGPITIGRLYRTKEGQLALENVSLQVGPRKAPYVLAKGNIRNLLQLKDLDFAGELSVPASLVLQGLGDDVAEAFGGVKADFVLDDAQGYLSLNRLDAYTVDTEIWALKVHAELGNIAALDELAFEFDLDVEDGAQFLGALNLEEVDVGPLEISASARGQGEDFSTSLGLMAGTSRLDSSLDTTVIEGRPSVQGRIYSARLDIEDLKNAVSAVVQLGKIGSGEKTGETTEIEDAGELEVQPLVLPEEEGKPTDLVDLEDLLLDTDLKVSIDIDEIVGQEGVSSLSSEFSSKDGKASIGPVEATYGGGYFKVAAEMDLVETPELVSVSGATSGWDFGKILDSVGLGIDAHGKLRGSFDVTGNRRSISAFINSMYGSASISMSEGDVATSLLELAGLGIFPWLFSEEFKQGYTDIVCVVAPIEINAGNVTFDSVVAETASVQLVARGGLDWKEDSIALRAEPRRVGDPLSRSAWPFEVSGKLSEPKFKLDVGGSRSKRADGADEMPIDRKPCTPDLRQLE